ncbi:hypothetical protein B0T20DRAFT_55589 [Sordaria brevicollis]|uniref:Uncharacterized protein n=1 Tax=Sordaria brevicollis TaxID=83679 RepID=A0AAE0P2U8_SORBR|nr:hypothetical protein B0T20DRAFT_55589 [Sordaria brevicollis]
MPAHRVYIETRAVDRSPRSPANNPPRSPRSPRHILRPRTRSEERIYVYREDRLPETPSSSSKNNNNTMSDRDRIFREAYEESYREIQDLRAKVEEKDLELAEKDALIKELQFDNQNLRRSLDSLSDLDNHQEDQIKTLRRKNSKLRNDKEDLNVRVRELRHEMDAKIRPMVDQINALRQEVANRRLQCESVERRNEDLERRMAKLRKNADEYAARNTMLEAQNESLRNQVQGVKAENARLMEVMDIERRLRVSHY